MKDKVAVVTGGTGALGSAVVASFLEDGWVVWVPSTSEATGEAHEDRRHTVRADLTDAGAVDAFFARVAAAHDGLDVLCNLVGGFAAADVTDTDPETWERMWRLNATAPFLSVRAAIPLMKHGGSIVNVAAAATQGDPKSGMSAYLAAKSAVVSLTRNLSAELAGAGITVNAVAPTIIDTPANRSAMPDADHDAWLAPEEIAHVIRFLAGPDARVVSGSVLMLR